MTVLPSRRAPGHLLGVAGTVLVFAGGMAATARLGALALLGVVVLAQVVTGLGWLLVTAPPSPRAVVAVGAGTALAADGLAAFDRGTTLAPLAGVLGLAVAATMILQLARGVARARVTEAMASSLGLAAMTVALSTLLVLARQHGGREVVTAGALAAGSALITARLVDLVLPVPHVAPGVDRGALGVVLGSMAGTAVSAYYAASGSVLTPRAGAILGWAVALVAVLADLAAAYALVSAPRRPGFAFVVGPLVALTAAAPVAYLVGILVLG